MASISIVTFIASSFFGNSVQADEPQVPAGCRRAVTVDDLLCLDRAGLESIYRSGSMPVIPDGKIRGTVILAPGSGWNRTASRASRIMWQGKVLDGRCGMGVNRFFGLRVVRGRLAAGTSWMDGEPSLILDYRETSLVYARVRDEIREVAPGVYLGAMYEERCCVPELKMFFALQRCESECARSDRCGCSATDRLP